MEKFRSIIESNYRWIIDESEDSNTLLNLAIKQLAIGQFEMARVSLRQLLQSTSSPTVDESTTTQTTQTTTNFDVNKNNAAVRLLLEVVEHGPPSDWLASPSMPSVVHLRWLCLRELCVLGHSQRVPAELRLRIEYELLLNVAFTSTTNDNELSTTQQQQQQTLRTTSEDAAKILAIRELLERYQLSTLGNSSTTTTTTINTSTTSSLISSTKPLDSSTELKVNNVTSSSTSTTTTTTTTIASTVGTGVASSSSSNISTSRRISALDSLMSLGRRFTTSTPDKSSGTTPVSTTTTTMNTTEVTSTTVASSSSPSSTTMITTTAEIADSVDSSSSMQQRSLQQQQQLPSLSATTLDLLRQLLRRSPTLFRCLLELIPRNAAHEIRMLCYVIVREVNITFSFFFFQTSCKNLIQNHAKQTTNN